MTSLLLLLLAAALAYQFLALLCLRRFFRSGLKPSPPSAGPGVTVFKPIKGLEAGTREYLATFLTQDYAPYQVLFGVADPNDPALPLLNELLGRFPRVDVEVLVFPQDLGVNPKVSILRQLERSAKHDLLVIADADVRVPTDFLATVAAALDSCVSVLVATSGSMGGNKYTHALISALLLNDAIGNVLGIPLEIAGFTDAYDPSKMGPSDPLMYLHRDFTVPRLQNEEFMSRMSTAGGHMTGNPDGDAGMWAYDRIKRRPEKRKLLVVLSDGSPACARYGDQMRYAQEVVATIQKEKRVDIVGIGIMDTNVTRIYKENYVIRSASELETALLSLVDKKIR